MVTESLCNASDPSLALVNVTSGSSSSGAHAGPPRHGQGPSQQKMGRDSQEQDPSIHSYLSLTTSEEQATRATRRSYPPAGPAHRHPLPAPPAIQRCALACTGLL